MMIIYYSHHHYFLFIDYLLLLSYYIYIYPILSHIIPMCFFHDYPMDFFFEKNPPGLAAGNRHGRGHSVPGRPG